MANSYGLAFLDTDGKVPTANLPPAGAAEVLVGDIYQTTVATNQAATAVNQNATATNQAATATNNNATATNQTTVATNQATTATNNAATATNQNTGGGGAHNNIQPSLVVYMWLRTA